MRTTQYTEMTGDISFNPQGDLKNPTSTLDQLQGAK
ncbi:branched-chain amino acid transport system substrate-binding protein [Paraburkholderia sartisoli]|uniref:Branched-chain amino acid transport system substrate-binding protein n=1 Tax=Paraburkholderia sartisoli TaxID=83784 RepID=A0A1H4HDH1_9BURK|nr:branched-chain amino acid transport system substrate-binding protein [Paraburkholderia sartisoli]